IRQLRLQPFPDAADLGKPSGTRFGKRWEYPAPLLSGALVFAAFAFLAASSALIFAVAALIRSAKYFALSSMVMFQLHHSVSLPYRASPTTQLYAAAKASQGFSPPYAYGSDWEC